MIEGRQEPLCLWCELRELSRSDVTGVRKVSIIRQLTDASQSQDVGDFLSTSLEFLDAFVEAIGRALSTADHCADLGLQEVIRSLLIGTVSRSPKELVARTLCSLYRQCLCCPEEESLGILGLTGKAIETLSPKLSEWPDGHDRFCEFLLHLLHLPNDQLKAEALFSLVQIARKGESASLSWKTLSGLTTSSIINTDNPAVKSNGIALLSVGAMVDPVALVNEPELSNSLKSVLLSQQIETRISAVAVVAKLCERLPESSEIFISLGVVEFLFETLASPDHSLIGIAVEALTRLSRCQSFSKVLPMGCRPIAVLLGNSSISEALRIQVLSLVRAVSRRLPNQLDSESAAAVDSWREEMKIEIGKAIEFGHLDSSSLRLLSRACAALVSLPRPDDYGIDLSHALGVAFSSIAPAVVLSHEDSVSLLCLCEAVSHTAVTSLGHIPALLLAKVGECARRHPPCSVCPAIFFRSLANLLSRVGFPTSALRDSIRGPASTALELIGQFIGKDAPLRACKVFLMQALVACHPGASQELRLAWETALIGLDDAEELTAALESPQTSEGQRGIQRTAIALFDLSWGICPLVEQQKALAEFTDRHCEQGQPRLEPIELLALARICATARPSPALVHVQLRLEGTLQVQKEAMLGNSRTELPPAGGMAWIRSRPVLVKAFDDAFALWLGDVSPAIQPSALEAWVAELNTEETLIPICSSIAAILSRESLCTGTGLASAALSMASMVLRQHGPAAARAFGNERFIQTLRSVPGSADLRRRIVQVSDSACSSTFFAVSLSSLLEDEISTRDETISFINAANSLIAKAAVHEVLRHEDVHGLALRIAPLCASSDSVIRSGSLGFIGTAEPRLLPAVGVLLVGASEHEQSPVVRSVSFFCLEALVGLLPAEIHGAPGFAVREAIVAAQDGLLNEDEAVRFAAASLTSTVSSSQPWNIVLRVQPWHRFIVESILQTSAAALPVPPSHLLYICSVFGSLRPTWSRDVLESRSAKTAAEGIVVQLCRCQSDDTCSLPLLCRALVAVLSVNPTILCDDSRDVLRAAVLNHVSFLQGTIGAASDFAQPPPTIMVSTLDGDLILPLHVFRNPPFFSREVVLSELESLSGALQ